MDIGLKIKNSKNCESKKVKCRSIDYRRDNFWLFMFFGYWYNKNIVFLGSDKPPSPHSLKIIVKKMLIISAEVCMG